jgi:ubiquinone/menaquinone biosynthesis C-methylase UbiE
MAASYDPTSYKINARDNWNVVAFEYDNDWASEDRGPFRSTAELVRVADIKPGDFVLDVACGTGAVARQAARWLHSSGMLVGIDFSREALKIARTSAPEGHLAEMDAENIGLRIKFDKILCQYALMFFPDPARVLARLMTLMKEGGRLAVTVHGTPERVPYFSTIMEPVLRYIPDFRPRETPTVHRFGKPEDLRQVISAAGFSEVSIDEFIFEYRAGCFDEYWQDYMSTTAASIRPQLESMGEQIVSAIRSEAEKKAKKFTKDGKICFPWQVLIANAYARKTDVTPVFQLNLCQG